MLKKQNRRPALGVSRLGGERSRTLRRLAIHNTPLHPYQKDCYWERRHPAGQSNKTIHKTGVQNKPLVHFLHWFPYSQAVILEMAAGETGKTGETA
jgi:hypothetical protein